MHVKTKRYYNQNAIDWAERTTNSFCYEKPFRLFGGLLKKGDRVIDIGCAHGIHVPLFLGIGRKLRYEGVDAAKAIMRIAKSRYPQLSFSVADAVTFKSVKKFNGFWSAATLMHVPKEKWPQLLANIESNIKKGGFGFISLPSSRSAALEDADERHFDVFSKPEFKKLVGERGWKVLRTGEMRPTRRAAWCWYIVHLPE